MTRPGVVVSSATAAPTLSVPTDTGVAFIATEAAMGPTEGPVRLNSLDQFVATFGQRVAGTYGYDALDAAFHEGLGTAYVVRLAEGGVVAKESATTIAGEGNLEAANPGTWGNGLSLVVAGSGEAFTAEVKLGTALVQKSLTLATTEALVAFLASGQYMRLTGVTKPTEKPKAATVALKGGTDGTVPVSKASTLAAALSTCRADLGPGQVLAPGKSSAEMHTAMLAHAAGTADAGVNRVAFLDGPVGASEAELKTLAGTQRGSVQDRYGALWAPWVQIPGLAPGTIRVVPWSSIQAGIVARNDAAGHPNQAGAGSFGVSRYATALNRTFTDAERENLLVAGVNTARSVYGVIESYAFRTLVDPNGTRGAWRELNHARLNMAIVAKSNAVGEEIIFSQLDGRGHTLAKFNGMLAAELKQLYDDGALYGDEPTEAYVVNTGPAVNPPAQLAEGVVKAVLSVRMSPHGELILIEIVKVPITVALAA